ncbi:MAG: hypothetical protein EBZ67_17260, partial [Chitinophagia bacterium]|nr:hypothetical protein [Chitinophagia bacterium]
TALGTFIFRACQGHSSASGVVPEALEMTLRRVDIDLVGTVFHFTRKHLLLSILLRGLQCGPALQKLGLGGRCHIHYLPKFEPGAGALPGVPSDAEVVIKIMSMDAGDRDQPLLWAANDVIISRFTWENGASFRASILDIVDRQTGDRDELWLLWNDAFDHANWDSYQAVKGLVRDMGKSPSTAEDWLSLMPSGFGRISRREEFAEVFGSKALEGLSDEVFQEGGEADRGVLEGSSSGSADPATNSQAPAADSAGRETEQRGGGPKSFLDAPKRADGYKVDWSLHWTRPPILPSLSLGLSAQPRRPLRSTRSSSSRPRPRAAGRLGGPSQSTRRRSRTCSLSIGGHPAWP